MNAQTNLEQRRVGDHPATTAGLGRGIRDSRESPKDRPAPLEPPRRGSAGREPAAQEQEREQSMSHAPRAESTLQL